MSKWNNIRKFDFSTGTYSGNYYKISEFDYFVDSEFGSDTNDGLTPETAFKTLSKITTLGSEYYIDGLTIAISGCFTEDILFERRINVIGVCGYNSKCLIKSPVNFGIKGNSTYRATNSTFQNLYISNFYSAIYGSGYVYQYTYMNNCIFENCNLAAIYRPAQYLYCYNTIFLELKNSTEVNVTIDGKNNTIFNLDKNSFQLYGNNWHFICKNGITAKSVSGNNYLNVTYSRYFTDNTETTPADLYIDSSNGNYGINPLFSTPIWDNIKQTYITANPLYATGTDGTNIGAGLTAININASDNSLKNIESGGNATYTNMQSNDSYEISRIDDATDGTIVSGIQDLGESKKGIQISAISTYGVTGTTITERLQESTPTITNGEDFYIQFGETIEECNSMTPILCEFGKPISYSKSGNILYGNSDSGFVPTKKVYAEFRYFKIQVKAQTIQ